MSEGRPVYFTPDDDAPVTNDWSREIDQLGAGVTVTGSVWAVSPAGPTLHDDAIASPRTTTFFSGGTAATDYTLANTATFSDGTVLKRNRVIKVAVDF